MAAKNIVLCSDGTGNMDIKARGTNVFKLYEAVDIQGHKLNPMHRPQVAFYDDGVGTSGLLPLKLLGGAFGWGFTQNVKDLYLELAHVYQPGDRLYLFGFSRGAYTVRALCGLIEYCGILDIAGLDAAGRRNRIDRCWNVFRTEAFQRVTKQQRQKGQPTKEDGQKDHARRKKLGAVMHSTHAPDGAIPIEFLGVWDTVGAVGAPFDELRDLLNWLYPMRFTELTPSCHIKRACHALSIDDERRTFRPELWNEEDVGNTKVDQVWFTGVHSNVGGGYSKHGLSLVTLDWMMAESEKCGLRFIESDRIYVRTHQDVHGKLYDSRAGLGVYYRWEPRDIATLCREHHAGVPKIHISLFERIANGTDAYAPGNIPYESQIITTNGTVKWPSPDVPGQLARQMAQLRPIPPSGSAVHSPLDTAQSLVKSGKMSYYVFIVCSLLVMGCLYRTPSWSMYPLTIAGWQLPPQSCAVMTLLLVMAGIFGWAVTVDKALATLYQNVWKAQRVGLREMLEETKNREPVVSAPAVTMRTSTPILTAHLYPQVPGVNQKCAYGETE
ncbi:MAG: protein of unknown function, DUF2235-containing [Nitrospira sp.]|nr:protein of unknown function, DUF2235-containing [Nitrospira sp.]